MGGVGVGWCGRLLGLRSGLVSRWLRLSPVVSLHVGGGCWLVWSASWALKWSCLPLGVGWCGRHLGLWSGLVSGCLRLSPVVSLHVGGGGWLVWSASWALKWSCLPLSPIVSGCLPSCGGRVLVGVAPSRTETCRDQNHRLQSKFAYCKLFGVYAGIIFDLFQEKWRSVLTSDDPRGLVFRSWINMNNELLFQNVNTAFAAQYFRSGYCFTYIYLGVGFKDFLILTPLGETCFEQVVATT